MKELLQKSGLTLLLVILMAPFVQAQPDRYNEKRKSFTQSYPLSATDKISLRNKYGNTKIKAWDKDEIKVDAEIVVKSNSAERSQSLIDGITISHSKTGDMVLFKTDIKNNNSNWNGRGNNYQSMEINYLVYIPVKNSLHISHQYGDVDMPDYAGSTDIQVQYGDLVGGALNGNNNEIDVAYGSVNLRNIKNGDINVKYSGCDIDHITGTADIDLAYCSDVNLGIDKNTGDIKLKNAYSGTVDIAVEENASASFEMEVTYSEAKNKNTKINFKQEDEDENKGCCNFTKEYSAKIGNGDSKIKIKSSYSGIKLK
jgi:Putative adhesin